jgi:hypothetical protein
VECAAFWKLQAQCHQRLHRIVYLRSSVVSQDQIILRNCVLNVADVNTDYEKENVKSPEMLSKDDWRTK